MAAINYILNFNDITKTGLTLSFTVFNLVSDNSSQTPPAIIELGNGFYKFSFDITTLSSDIYYVVSDGGSNILTGTLPLISLPSINDLVLRVLGLVQENIYIDNLTYDGNKNLLSSRIRTYTNNSDVGTDNNVLATYNMTSTYSGTDLQSFQVEMI